MTALPRSLSALRLWVLAWFVAWVGVGIASPLVNPQAMELVCSSAGMVKLYVQTDDGPVELGASGMDCPLCVPSAAPPPAVALSVPAAQPLGYVLQSIPAARLAAATAAPLPARGPPLFTL
ncbi:MAG: hypothetical protein J7556_03895 [Acidovorax sp.]|nr:hypothetical protein [Acidovorax sp.]